MKLFGKKLKLEEKNIQKYDNTPLIIPAYAGKPKNYYSVDDFVTLDDLSYYLGEVDNGEAYITPKGMDFFRDVFGISNLSKILLKDNFQGGLYKTVEEIEEFFSESEKEGLRICQQGKENK